MSRSAAALAMLVLAILAGAGGYWRGEIVGRAAETADRNAQTLQGLGQLLDQHKTLARETTAASKAMRTALAQRQVRDQATTKEMSDALEATAGDRAGCLFDAGVMRQLAAARDRAAEAAAGGVRGAVPGPADGAPGP